MAVKVGLKFSRAFEGQDGVNFPRKPKGETDSETSFRVSFFIWVERKDRHRQKGLLSCLLFFFLKYFIECFRVEFMGSPVKSIPLGIGGKQTK